MLHGGPQFSGLDVTKMIFPPPLPPLRSPSGGVRVRACGGALRGRRTAVRRTRSRAERLTAWTSEVPSFLPATTGRLEKGGRGEGWGGEFAAR